MYDETKTLFELANEIEACGRWAFTDGRGISLIEIARQIRLSSETENLLSKECSRLRRRVIELERELSAKSLERISS